MQVHLCKNFYLHVGMYVQVELSRQLMDRTTQLLEIWVIGRPAIEHISKNFNLDVWSNLDVF